MAAAALKQVVLTVPDLPPTFLRTSISAFHVLPAPNLPSADPSTKKKHNQEI
jgi:hypothetical protein